jgi:hypothetical protein
MLTITLPPNVETRLQDEARRQGIDPAEYASKLLEEALPHPDQATLDLLAKWKAEDQTDDPEEIARREQEAEEFMRSLAQSRIDMEGPNARKLWP